jgi:excisionase family DNA binding protein
MKVDPDPARLAVGAREVAGMLGVSERHVRALTAAGRLPHVRAGHRVLYPTDLLREWLRAEAAKQGGPR